MGTVDKQVKGRYVVNKDGDVIPGDAQLYSPSVQLGLSPAIGPSHVGEWLMIDVRIAKLVDPGSRLYGICQELGERGACGVIEATLVIDLLEARSEDRKFLLDKTSWPTEKS